MMFTPNASPNMPALQRAGLCLALLFLSLSVPGLAAETDVPNRGSAGGQVTLSLEDYQRLLREAASKPLSAPSAYAIGQSVLNIVFSQQDGHVTATVQAQLEAEVFADTWTLVPLLGPGAALESASVNDAEVQLVQRAEGLFWLAEKRQKARLKLTYHVDSRFTNHAYITSLPVPRAAATRFSADIPRTHIDLAVAPVVNLKTSEIGGHTRASGTLPAIAGMMVSWRTAVEREYLLGQADYSGVVQASQSPGRGTAIAWHAAISAELLTDGEATVPLVSTASTLVAVEVDGKPAAAFSEEGRFALRLAGRGKHRIDVRFLSAVTHPDGVPTSGFDIPDVPVSKFTLRLPGDKLVRASAHGDQSASVEASQDNGDTVATFYIPMSSRVALNWMEAVPADLDVERRANAVVYQALYAGEGVLYGLAAIRYEITRGEANSLAFRMPAGAQVNHITSTAAAIADWVALEDEQAPAGAAHIRVFLDRAVSGEFTLDVDYEQLLDDSHESPAVISAPIVRALDVSRQKGMVALLAGSDLALAPVQHSDMSEVGENELPAFFRNQLEQTVSHTFKYHSASPQLAVRAVTPERQQAKFNAQIDSLISIGEVTLKAQVSIENDVKSGVLRELNLVLPADVNILGVSGPSIRNHTVTAKDGKQRVNIEFTREMDGQFRIDLNYERIMLDGSEETHVPRVEVAGADVAHGRIAIEALSALEVQPSVVEQLSALEINELPRQLVLKTTNPILLAYRYVTTEKPFKLQLRITRHEVIDVQVAAIDTANYQTLFTTDGLAVTRVQFDVRNSRRQFLRLSLPPGSEVWSAFVNGDAQKPAFASDSPDGATDVLIKMINSATAFPVELVYATRGDPMDNFGRIQGSLPRPDMIVTHTNWNVYVPSAPRYGVPRTNMQILASAVMTSVADASAELLRGAVAGVVSGQPLHIDLPAQGLLYRFAKLYANQSAEDAHFSMRYVDRAAGFAGWWISVLAVLAVWAGIVLLSADSGALPAARALPAFLPWALLCAGMAAAILSITVLGASVLPPSILSLALALALAAWKGWTWWRRERPAFD